MKEREKLGRDKHYDAEAMGLSSSGLNNPVLAYQESLDWLHSQINYERLVKTGKRYPFRLNRMADLLKHLGIGHLLSASLNDSARPCPPIVHIAGTKGKGSTAMMVAAALTASGLRTGCYTSPHLHQLEERFRVDGENCPAESLVRLVEELRVACEQMSSAEAASDWGPATFFELTTAIALLHFHRSECDVVVLEVGLGGRLDSTNVCRPAVTVITSIGLDHQHVLGDTKEEIAAEKAGIIKQHVPVICGAIEPGPQEVINQIAKSRDAECLVLGTDFSTRKVTGDSARSGDWGARFDFQASNPTLRALDTIDLALEGDHQTRNAAVAIAALQLLNTRCGLSVAPANVRKALSSLNCPGRIERYVMPNDATVIVDAAHNEDSMIALCKAVQLRAHATRNSDVKEKRPVHFLFGTSVDKDAKTMLRLIEQLADRILLTQFKENPRFLPAATLLEAFESEENGLTTAVKDLRVVDDPLRACEIAMAELPANGILVVCGSFFLAAETRGWFAERQV